MPVVLVAAGVIVVVGIVSLVARGRVAMAEETPRGPRSSRPRTGGRADGRSRGPTAVRRGHRPLARGAVSPLPRVAVIFTGGTISMTVDAAAGGAVPTLGGADLLAAVPGLARRADVVPIDLGRVPASHLSFADVLRIRAHHRRRARWTGACAASWSSRAPTRSRRQPSPGTSAIAIRARSS